MHDQHTPHAGTTPPTIAGSLALGEQRPVWPTVVGIIAILYGTFSILMTAVGLLMMQSGFVSEQPAPEGAVLKFIQSTGWITFTTILGTAASILLIAAGAGLIKRRRWSIASAKIWAWYTIAICAMGAIFAMLTFDEIIATTQGQAPGMGAGAMYSMMIVMAVFGIGVSLAFPVFLLIWFSRAARRAHIATWR